MGPDPTHGSRHSPLAESERTPSALLIDGPTGGPQVSDRQVADAVSVVLGFDRGALSRDQWFLACERTSGARQSVVGAPMEADHGR